MGSHVTLDVPLSVSQVSTTVEVVAVQAAEVNTQTQEVSQIITPEQVQQPPEPDAKPLRFRSPLGEHQRRRPQREYEQPADWLPEAGQNNTSYRGAGYSINGQRVLGYRNPSGRR